ncbi:MAG: hypothetical protein WBA74_00405 [Cyclobacteriaceae bacterium]
MSKLKKYNQILLAVLGTLGILLLLFALWINSRQIIYELFSSSSSVVSEGVIVENEKDEENNRLRGQIISLGQPQLVDSVKAIYVTAVSTISLDDPETISADPFVALEGSRRDQIDYYDTWGKYRIASVNNIIVKQQTDPAGKMVFDSKIHISQYTYRTWDDRHFLLIKGCSKDTNKDNKLTDEDQNSFYVYDIIQKQLFSYPLPRHHLAGFKLLYPSNDILLSYTFDRNEDGNYENDDPVLLKTLTVGDAQLKDYVAPQIMKKLQHIIDE